MLVIHTCDCSVQNIAGPSSQTVNCGLQLLQAAQVLIKNKDGLIISCLLLKRGDEQRELVEELKAINSVMINTPDVLFGFAVVTHQSTCGMYGGSKQASKASVNELRLFFVSPPKIYLSKSSTMLL